MHSTHCPCARADLQKVSDGQAEAVEMEEKVINEGE